MEIRIGIMKLFGLLLLLSIVAAENSVLLKAGFQKITSSTLKWVSPNSESIFRDAVVGSVEYTPHSVAESDSSRTNLTDPSQIKVTNVYVCRTRVDGNWIPGTLFDRSRVCVVSLFERVFQKDQYEILQNVDQAARLIWRDWEWTIEIPQKAVSAGDYYIAHTTSKTLRIYTEKVAVGRSHWIGKIDPREGVYGKMSVVTEKNIILNDMEKGQVLMEIEPVMYELSINKLTTSREKVISKTVLKLGEVTLRNDLPSQMKVESVITYQWKYNSSWGQGKAMLRGLNTRIFFPNNNEEEMIRWGILKEEIRNGIQSVEADLEAGTAVQVVLQANLYEVEVPYIGSLLSVFNDSNTMNRTVYGTWLRTALVDIDTVFGPQYYLHNNSLVPTTTTTTTTTVATTAETTTTTTTVTPSTKADDITKRNDSTSQDGNKNSSSLPVRDHNVMNDGSDAMELNKKESNHGSGNSSNSLTSYSCLIISSLLITTARSRFILSLT